jgi:hypothetical protein
LQNWFDANSACASVGGQLPSILSATDNSFVASLFNVSELITKLIEKDTVFNISEDQDICLKKDVLNV